MLIGNQRASKGKIICYINIPVKQIWQLKGIKEYGREPFSAPLRPCRKMHNFSSDNPPLCFSAFDYNMRNYRL